MRLLVDAQLPPALARWLTAAGHPSEHVADIGMAAAPDSAVWEYAARDSEVIVTKDQDFARDAPEEDATTFVAILPRLIERKLHLFPADLRAVLDWHVERKSSGKYLATASSLC
jgi:uncharacterized protein with PIN domain